MEKEESSDGQYKFESHNFVTWKKISWPLKDTNIQNFLIKNIMNKNDKAESTIDTPEFLIHLDTICDSFKHRGKFNWNTEYLTKRLIAHIEAVREKDRDAAFKHGMDMKELMTDDEIMVLRERCNQLEDANLALLDRAQAAEAELKAIAERQAADLPDVQIEEVLQKHKDVCLMVDWSGYLTTKKAIVGFAKDIAALFSPAQQEPAKDVWTDGINPAHVAAYDAALKEAASATDAATPEGANKTPLYIEDLIEMLSDQRTYAVSSFMGATDRVVNHRGLLDILHVELKLAGKEMDKQ